MIRVARYILVLLVLAQSASGASILIYGPSMGSSTPNEQTIAEGEGHTVTVVEEAAWSAMTQGDFAAYDAIVFGDNDCDGDYSTFDTADANKSVWGPVVTGNVVVHTFDPFAHESDAGAIPLVENGINWAASAPGQTGLYLSTGCYPNSTPETLDFMSTFGTFVTEDTSGDTVTVENSSHPVLAGISEADLEGWGDSWHGRFTTYPGTFSLVASDGGMGLIVARSALAVALPAEVPALSPAALALLGLALGVAALIALRR